METIGFPGHFTILDTHYEVTQCCCNLKKHDISFITEDNSFRYALKVWNSTWYKIWLWFQNSDNSKKCLMSELIKTTLQHHDVPLCDVGHLTDLEFLDEIGYVQGGMTIDWPWVFRIGLPQCSHTPLQAVYL